MSRMLKGAARFALVLSIALALGFAGCGGAKTGPRGGPGGGDSGKVTRGKKLSEADQARLDEARKSAEDAERKLSELRLERMQLEGGGK